MKGLIKYQKTIIKIVSLVLFFHTALFADTSYSENSYIMSAYNSNYTHQSHDSIRQDSSKDIEVSLNSFGSISIVITLILTSLLGAFFVRDEFNGILE